jgi:carbon-monoxide dehydrogenase large subunit
MAQPDHNHASELRVEDDILVRGAGRFVADVKPANAAHVYFLRSPHGHAAIKSIDTSAALAAPGVLAVLTAADMAQAGVGNVAVHQPMAGLNGNKLIVSHRPALADTRVRHIGEPVAAVVAETYLAAVDASEHIVVDYEDLPPAVEIADALADGAPQIFDDVKGNVAFDWVWPVDGYENKAREVARIIDGAAHVVKVSVINQRLQCATMEPRGASATYDPATERYELNGCSQGAGPLRDMLSRIMNVPKEKLRVITEDVGGAFGMKSGAYPEYPVLLIAARKIGRPVHWMSGRSEAFLSDNQGRDAVTSAELALDAKGKFLALRVRHKVGMGAYITSAGGNLAVSNFARCFPAMYDIPHLDVAGQCVYTNTAPNGPYRGAGRPEANYVLERAVAEAARITGIDPVKLRRRNLIPNKAMPYRTAVGTTFDSGEFTTVFDKSLALADLTGFAKRRKESASRGKLRGLGLSCFLEHAGGMPTEGAGLKFPGGEQLLVTLGVQSTGQGHATVYPRMVSERLGIPFEQIQHRHGDSDHGIVGAPSVASRSTITAGSAVVQTIDVMLNKGKAIAALLLEASEADIVYREGGFEVAGTDKRLSLFAVAEKAKVLAKEGKIAEDLDTKTSRDTPQTFPNGVHVAEVEIDPQTGECKVVGYTAVDDCGTILNHTLVEGQVHGALAQGLGQALFEVSAHDATGQMLTGSFMDYTMPRADDMPVLAIADHVVPATTNPLGVKGVGEAGTTGSLAAIMNAIADAIPGGAANHMDMPATREKVWQACQAATAAGHKMPRAAK